MDWALIDAAAYGRHLHDTRVNGRRLRYLDVGEGPPVLLIHGIGGSWTHWLANLDTLSASHRVIAVDMPGFGASDPLPPRSELTETVDTMIALIEELEITRTAVVGHSLGGLVAWLLASAAPQLVTRLVLVDAASLKLPPWRIQMIVWGFAVVSRIVALPGVAYALLHRPRLRNALLAGMVRDPGALSPTLAAALIAPLINAPGFPDALWAGPRAAALLDPSAMATPTLAIWGQEDPIFPVAEARKLVAGMADARLVEIPRCGHCPQLEWPEAFDHTIAPFLAAV